MARYEPHAGTIPTRQNAEAVMFDFVQPAGTFLLSAESEKESKKNRAIVGGLALCVLGAAIYDIGRAFSVW
jgi:hypothetical protein